MTVNAKDSPTNHLNVNEIENITSPNSLELGSGKEGEFKDFPVNSFVINLVSCILQMADEKTTRMLRHTLEEIRISSKLANKLKSYRIETVYDLVRYSEERLTHLRIISNTDLRRINQALKKTGLTLGTDVRWVETSQEYYIKKCSQGATPVR
jgi:DNA-directed RNA polymerase alpha subunit